MKLLHARFLYLYICFSFFFTAALWYTVKIDWLDQRGALKEAGYALLHFEDGPILLLGTAFFSLLLPRLTHCLSRFSYSRRPSADRTWFFPAFLLMALWQLPFLLSFYPAPGMNDTVFMMENPLYASVQFPWLYSVIYGYGASWGKEALGSREPVIFLFSLLQLLLISYGLTAFAFWVKGRVHVLAGWGLYEYFLFFPMVGNYSIAAVRDGLFSLGLLFFVWLFLRRAEGERWGRASQGILIAALLSMLLRSNGLLVALLVCLALFFLEKRKEILLFFMIFALISTVPAQVIQRTHHWEPLFQESMAIPLQQLGRTMVLGGERSEETKTLMENLLTEEEWKKEYSPYTVDFVKWHDHFHRNWLNGQKKEFLSAWVDTGLRNPRIYVEGWLTETYALWNLDPFEYDVQSRFGWALSDENTEDMKPADNDRMATGDFPMPLWLKAGLANVSYEGSYFIGTGLSLWIVLFLGLIWIRQGRTTLLFALLPLLANTGTLLLSTPASSVFRYSFAYVLCLPVLVAVTLCHGTRESEE